MFAPPCSAVHQVRVLSHKQWEEIGKVRSARLFSFLKSCFDTEIEPCWRIIKLNRNKGWSQSWKILEKRCSHFRHSQRSVGNLRCHTAKALAWRPVKWISRPLCSLFYGLSLEAWVQVPQGHKWIFPYYSSWQLAKCDSVMRQSNGWKADTTAVFGTLFDRK